MLKIILNLHFILHFDFENYLCNLLVTTDFYKLFRCQPAGCHKEQKIGKKLAAYEGSGLPNVLPVLEPIFLRFKHFRTWKFVDDCGTILFRHLLNFFNNDQCIPANVHGLSFSGQSTMPMPDRFCFVSVQMKAYYESSLRLGRGS